MNIPLKKVSRQDNILNIKTLWQLNRKLNNRKDSFLHRRNKILLTLISLPINNIVEYFNYNEMKEKHSEYCPLYLKNQICHEVNLKYLNCFGCMCPYYKLEISIDPETELYKLGQCLIKSNFGFYKQTTTKDNNKAPYLILNCLNCSIPHQHTFVRKYIELEKFKFLKTSQNLYITNNIV